MSVDVEKEVFTVPRRDRFVIQALGGRGGIRTHGELAPTAVFKTAALNHSATLPRPELCDIAARAEPCKAHGEPSWRDGRFAL